APDTAVLVIGVETRAPTVAEARAQAADAQTAVLGALTGSGIPRESIRTTRLSIQPDYDYREGGRTLLGYVVTNSVEVRTTKLDDLGTVIDRAVAAGGNLTRLDSLRFEL